MSPSALLALTVGGFFAGFGHGLRESFYMLWDLLWPLVLGFTLSGAVQAFASRDAMGRHLGNRRPAGVARASLYGVASSSCSYAASALARSLFAQGADFVTAMVFMFASTNLVIELGIVLVVLMGWQFVAAEAVGGVIMILLLVAWGGVWLRGRALDEARRNVASGVGAGARPPTAESVEAEGWKRRIRTAGGWSVAAAYTIGDLTMLRVELVVGFVAAGFVSVLVPARVWADVFLHGHGWWTNVENALIGPLVAIVSFVCSVGNVPLAAALWKGGTSFGGVMAFVFADLVTLPLLLVYRRQYGWRMAVRMLLVFWPVMSAAGLVTGYLFEAFGWVPSVRPRVVAGDTLRWGYTTALDIAALVLLAVLYWLYRNRARLDGGSGYARDPVCGMTVEIAHAPASVMRDGNRYWFCSDGCADRFAAGLGHHPGEVTAGGEGVPVQLTRRRTGDRPPSRS